jgi:hypothetical protein
MENLVQLTIFSASEIAFGDGPPMALPPDAVLEINGRSFQLKRRNVRDTDGVRFIHRLGISWAVSNSSSDGKVGQLGNRGFR